MSRASDRRRRKQRARGLRAQPQRPNPKFSEHTRCERCYRYHLESEPCWFCEPQLPEACTCEIEWPPMVWMPKDWPAYCSTPDAHHHYTHHILTHLSQVDYELADDSILLDAEHSPGPEDDHVVLDVGYLRQGSRRAEKLEVDHVRHSRDWRSDPGLKEALDDNPDLRRRIGRRGPARLATGADAVFEWAELTENEATVMSLRLFQGYTPEAIAFELARPLTWVQSLLSSAGARLNLTVFGADVSTWPAWQGWMPDDGETTVEPHPHPVAS